MQLKGIFPVVPTLFKSDDTLDLEAQRKVVQYALKTGAHGLVFPGVASEYNFLSLEERATLLELIVKEVDGQIPIIGGASASEASDIVQVVQEASKLGLKHYMIMAPGHLGQDTQAQLAFFEEILQAVPDIEIILQNAPKPIGAGLSIDMMVEIASAFPQITYIKEETLPSGPSITALQKANICHLKAIFGGGGSRYIVDEFRRGAVGAMPAIELLDYHVALYKAHEAGQEDLERKIYAATLPLLVLQTIYRMRLTKYVLKARNIVDALSVRAPLPELDECTKQDIDLMLKDLNEFPIR